MFVDNVEMTLKAGDGGNGIVNFRHEKFIEKGGPDGGDGGKGGDIVVISSNNQDTLAIYRYKKEMTAMSGAGGSKRKRHGKNGEDLELLVPVGTVVLDEDGKVLVDLVQDNQRAVVCRGGSGGYGNAHFTSSVRQAPRVAEKGEKGEQRHVRLELRMIADVGLVGQPNAGKSTLLASISNARPEIADYAFTTLSPNLGMVDVDDTSLLFADIPGLIEGASGGKGLGDEFLRHVERTSVLLHLVDAYQDDVTSIYKVVQTELKNYSKSLAKKPQIVVLNKIDGLDDEIAADKIQELRKIVPKTTKIMAISAKSKQGLQELLRATVTLVNKHKTKVLKTTKKDLPVIRLQAQDLPWQVIKEKKYFLVTGGKIEKFAHRTDYENSHGIRRLRDIMKKMGIMHELEKQNIEPGTKIKFGKSGDYEIEY